MRRRIIVRMAVVALVLGGSLLLGMGTLFAADKSPAGTVEGVKGPKATLKTKFGDMEIVFFPEKTTQTGQDSSPACLLRPGKNQDLS